MFPVANKYKLTLNIISLTHSLISTLLNILKKT